MTSSYAIKLKIMEHVPFKGDRLLTMTTPFKPPLFSISATNHIRLGAEYFTTTETDHNVWQAVICIERCVLRNILTTSVLFNAHDDPGDNELVHCVSIIVLEQLGQPNRRWNTESTIAIVLVGQTRHSVCFAIFNLGGVGHSRTEIFFLLSTSLWSLLRK